MFQLQSKALSTVPNTDTVIVSLLSHKSLTSQRIRLNGTSSYMFTVHKYIGQTVLLRPWLYVYALYGLPVCHLLANSPAGGSGARHLVVPLVRTLNGLFLHERNTAPTKP